MFLILQKDHRQFSSAAWMLYHVIRLISVTTCCEILHDQIYKTNAIVIKLFSSVEMGESFDFHYFVGAFMIFTNVYYLLLQEMNIKC